MAIDASIYSQFAPAAKSARDFQNDDLDRQTRMQGIESNKLALLGQRQKQAEYERATKEQAENNNLLQRFAQESGGDQGRFVSLLRSSGRPALMAQGDATEKAMLERRNTESLIGERAVKTSADQVKAAIDRLSFVGQVAGGVRDQATYDAALNLFGASGIDVQQLGAPLQYDPQVVERFRTQAITEKDRLEQDFKQRQQAETERNNVAQVEATIRGQDVQARTTRRGQDFVNDRAIEAQGLAQGTATAEAGGPSQVQFTRKFGKAAPGYRWKADGSQEAIPGGPADRKNTDAGIREARQREASVAQADRVIAKVDQALADVGVTTAGPGSILTGIPGTSARNLDSTLQTIKSNLGFAELQAMRDASPTGGALGAIAVQELMALQATVASLDQGQSPTQLRKSLGDIKTHYTNWKNAVSGKTPEASKPGRPAPNADPAKPFSDADKERRYQEWKRQQGAK